MLTQISSIGKALSQWSVRVIVNPSLPGTVRVGKVDLDAGGRHQFLMRRHFLSLIHDQGKERLCLGPIQHMPESTQGRFSSGTFLPGQHGEQGGVLDQRTGGRTVACPLGQVAFPVPGTSHTSISGGRSWSRFRPQSAASRSLLAQITTRHGGVRRVNGFMGHLQCGYLWMHKFRCSRNLLGRVIRKYFMV